MGNYAQMNPPIRNLDHQNKLWDGITNGTADIIGSDHAPHSREEKDVDYPNSPSGMPGVQTLFPVMLNHVNDGKLTLEQLMNYICSTQLTFLKLKVRVK